MTTMTIRRADVPPTADVVRTAPFALRAAGPAGDGNTLDGYAAVFNRETVIDSWEGRFKERIAPGAMRKSFREKPPVIQFDHGRHPMVGSIPIARLDSIAEDVDPVLAPDGGAHVVGTLHNNWLVQPVRDAIASGSIDGMSFRFTVVVEEWHDKDGQKIKDTASLTTILRETWDPAFPEADLPVRTLRELKVPELGPVVFPAYGDTSVGVRSKVTIDLARLDDPEQRSLLARAVLMADRAENGDDPGPQGTDTPVLAAEHVGESNDTPRTTDAEGAAGEHESTITPIDVRHTLEGLRDVMRTITETKGVYHK